MASPAPCLVVLRRQVDARWPRRSLASDGIMGDDRHCPGPSDHCDGNAIDLTHSPRQGFDAGGLAEAFRVQMLTARAGRLTYIIWARRIARARTGWKWELYKGDPHITHVHLSIRADLRKITRPWTVPMRFGFADLQHLDLDH